MRVRDKNSIESGCQRWINIGARRIANHPGVYRVKVKFVDNTMIGRDILFRNNYHARNGDRLAIRRARIIKDAPGDHIGRQRVIVSGSATRNGADGRKYLG